MTDEKKFLSTYLLSKEILQGIVDEKVENVIYCIFNIFFVFCPTIYF